MIILTFYSVVSYYIIRRRKSTMNIYSPYVLQCMHFKHEGNSNSGTRTVMDYEFDFCLNCNREIWIDGKNFKLKPGCFSIRKPGQKVRSIGVYDCYMLTLDFSNNSSSSKYSRNTATQLQKVFDSEIWDVLPSVFEPAHYDDYIRIFKNILSLNELNINENKKTHSLINELLHILISDAFHHISYSDTIPNTPIDKVCAYIKKHYTEEIRLDDLASIAHLNKNYLVRQFKKKFGISPINYLINVRMEHAKKFLAETDLPIKIVASNCGYSDPAFFNSYFKKQYSLTPVEYRLSQQGVITIEQQP